MNSAAPHSWSDLNVVEHRNDKYKTSNENPNSERIGCLE